MEGGVGHTGGLTNPGPWRGRCRAGYSIIGGPPLPRKRAPLQKKDGARTIKERKNHLLLAAGVHPCFDGPWRPLWQPLLALLLCFWRVEAQGTLIHSHDALQGLWRRAEAPNEILKNPDSFCFLLLCQKTWHLARQLLDQSMIVMEDCPQRGPL